MSVEIHCLMEKIILKQFVLGNLSLYLQHGDFVVFPPPIHSERGHVSSNHP